MKTKEEKTIFVVRIYLSMEKDIYHDYPFEALTPGQAIYQAKQTFPKYQAYMVIGK